jgi:hypothetical protein
MRVSILTATVCALVGAGLAVNSSTAQSPEAVRVATATPAAEKAPKFTFIFFWKENNALSQNMSNALKAAVEQRSERAVWTSVNVTDPAQRTMVERYHVQRAPMPMVICVAGNGAITGAITRQITDQAIEKTLVTPAMADAAKAIQEKRLVVVHIKQEPRSPLPAGAADFMADPMFKERTTAINFVAGDEAEARFLTEMEIKTQDVADSMVVLLAPPGVLVGKFPSTATTEQIGAALHAAGKCCDDPNCKHNQKGM